MSPLFCHARERADKFKKRALSSFFFFQRDTAKSSSLCTHAIPNYYSTPRTLPNMQKRWKCQVFHVRCLHALINENIKFFNPMKKKKKDWTLCKPNFKLTRFSGQCSSTFKITHVTTNPLIQKGQHSLNFIRFYFNLTISWSIDIHGAIKKITIYIATPYFHGDKWQIFEHSTNEWHFFLGCAWNVHFCKGLRIHNPDHDI